MTAPDTSPSPVDAASSPSPAVAPAPPAASTGSRIVVGAALVLAGLSAAATASLWQRLGKTEEELARRSVDTLAEAASARTLAAQAEAQSKELQARLGVAEVRLSEVSLQRSQLEELMLSVSRSRDDSLVQDIESAVRLAVQQSQLTGSAQPLISALQGAEQRIEKAAQPRLNPVQRAIGRDIERLRAAAAVDTPALAARLDELVRQLDSLPLRDALAPVPEGDAAPAGPASPQAGAANAVAAAEPEPMAPAAAPASEGEPTLRSGFERAWARFDAWRQSAVSRWWGQFKASTADLVRVSRIDQPEAALLAPEQSYFLRENIKLWLLNARLGLLARQFDTARADVASARKLVERYFDPTAPSTRSTVQMLTQLQTDLRQEALPRPDETLTALGVAASGR